jgi:hypothetical protein
MGADSRNKRRVKTLPPGPVIVVRTLQSEDCISGKKKFATAEEAPTRGFDGTPLRWYVCDLCQWIHVTSGGTVRWRKPERGHVAPGVEGRARAHE